MRLVLILVGVTLKHAAAIAPGYGYCMSIQIDQNVIKPSLH